MAASDRCCEQGGGVLKGFFLWTFEALSELFEGCGFDTD
jgi:hypothetical protein